jgi:hypothetical protein
MKEPRVPGISKTSKNWATSTKEPTVTKVLENGVLLIFENRDKSA